MGGFLVGVVSIVFGAWLSSFVPGAGAVMVGVGVISVVGGFVGNAV